MDRRDEPMAAERRWGEALAARAAETCLEADELIALASSRPWRRRAARLDHLSACPRCRAALRDLRALDRARPGGPWWRASAGPARGLALAAAATACAVVLGAVIAFRVGPSGAERVQVAVAPLAERAEALAGGDRSRVAPPAPRAREEAYGEAGAARPRDIGPANAKRLAVPSRPGATRARIRGVPLAPPSPGPRSLAIAEGLDFRDGAVYEAGLRVPGLTPGRAGQLMADLAGDARAAEREGQAVRLGAGAAAPLGAVAAPTAGAGAAGFGALAPAGAPPGRAIGRAAGGHENERGRIAAPVPGGPAEEDDFGGGKLAGAGGSGGPSAPRPLLVAPDPANYGLLEERPVFRVSPPADPRLYRLELLAEPAGPPAAREQRRQDDGAARPLDALRKAVPVGPAGAPTSAPVSVLELRDGGVAAIRPVAPLKPGLDYLFRVQPTPLAAPEPNAPPSGLSFRALTVEEREQVLWARAHAARAPLASVLVLYGAGRYAEALDALRHAQPGKRTDAWRARIRASLSERTLAEPPPGAPAQAAPRPSR
ncbi:MAG: hypothetical protein IT208_03585 [Chthonomonadales bacterium]|nr:hypothetical protein [Chthonomonadales bacterium]